MTRMPRVGLVLPMFSGDEGRVRRAALDAERLGYDGVFAFDHFFPPGMPAHRPSLEAFTTLGMVAASTERVAIGTLVTRAVLRPAGMIAKLAATIDDVAGGRMILGIGSGDPIDEPEHVAFGFTSLSVPARRAHLAETTAAVKALFGGRAYAGGEHVPPLAGPLLPPPARPGGPPVWLGAQADEVVRTAARLADGWNGWSMDVERFRSKAALLHGEAAAAGRAGAVEATWAGIVLVGEDEAEAERLAEERRRQGMEALGWVGAAGRFGAFLRDLGAAGATWVIVVLAGPGDRRRLVAEQALSERDPA